GPKNCAGKECGKGSIPDPFEGKNDTSRAKCPEPGSQRSERDTADATSGEVKGYRSGRRENAIHYGRCKKRRIRELAEGAKDRGQQRRINGREPSGWACWVSESIAETAALCQGIGDVAGFVFEGDRSENFVRNNALLVPDKSGAH